MNNAWLEKVARSASWILLLGRGVFLSVIVLLILMRSVVTVVHIDGSSMSPTLEDGQWVWVDLISKQISSWHYSDVAILRFPGDPIHSLYVKRIIGLPGDRVQLKDGKVIRNGVLLDEPYLLHSNTEPGVINLPQLVPVDEYLVLGDNRQISNDSRFFGFVPEHDLIGKVRTL